MTPTEKNLADTILKRECEDRDRLANEILGAILSAQWEVRPQCPACKRGYAWKTVQSVIDEWFSEYGHETTQLISIGRAIFDTLLRYIALGHLKNAD